MGSRRVSSAPVARAFIATNPKSTQRSGRFIGTSATALASPCWVLLARAVPTRAPHRAQPVELDEEVPRQRCCERDGFAGHGMLEGEGGRVEKKAGASNGRPTARDEVSDVDTLAHDRAARLGEVDPDLVCSARLEPNSGERGANEPLHDVDVRNRALSIPRAPGGAAEPIPPVRNETAFDAL